MDCDSVEARSKLARVCNAMEKKVLYAKMADMNEMYNLWHALDQKLKALDAENEAQIQEKEAAYQAEIAAKEELAKIEERKRAAAVAADEAVAKMKAAEALYQKAKDEAAEGKVTQQALEMSFDGADGTEVNDYDSDDEQEAFDKALRELDVNEAVRQAREKEAADALAAERAHEEYAAQCKREEEAEAAKKAMFMQNKAAAIAKLAAKGKAPWSSAEAGKRKAAATPTTTTTNKAARFTPVTKPAANQMPLTYFKSRVNLGAKVKKEGDDDHLPI